MSFYFGVCTKVCYHCMCSCTHCTWVSTIYRVPWKLTPANNKGQLYLPFGRNSLLYYIFNTTVTNFKNQRSRSCGFIHKKYLLIPFLPSGHNCTQFQEQKNQYNFPGVISQKEVSAFTNLYYDVLFGRKLVPLENSTKKYNQFGLLKHHKFYAYCFRLCI